MKNKIFKSNIIAKVIKYNKIIHSGEIKKHKCKNFKEIVKEIESNEFYSSVSCSECNHLFGLISKKTDDKK